MEVVIVLVIVALVCAVTSFLAVAGVANLVYRLVRGRFFGLLNLPAAIVFGIYLLLWILVWAEVFSNARITH